MIPMFRVNVAPGVGAAMQEVLESGYLTEGPRVKGFEHALGQWTGSNRVLATNSCTSAITLALRAWIEEEEFSVVSTPMTCSATNLPILHTGGVPIWADVDPRTGLIDPHSVAEILKTGQPRAIIAVDWGGAKADIASLAAMRKREAVVIEDAAHAFGTTGNDADATCFSFQAIKHITTGDGGAISFGLDAPQFYYERARLLRWFGINREALVEGDSRIELNIFEAGYKMHMNDLTAAMGLAQLDAAGEILAHHRRIGAFYDEHLDERFGRPPSDGSRWLYTVLLPEKHSQRAFREFMAVEHNVQVSQVHRRNDSYSVFPNAEHSPGVDEFCAHMICIPIHTGIGEEESRRVVDACNDWLVT